MYKLKMQTPNLTAQNIDKIAALFPNCITEMLDEEKSTPDHKVYKRGINFELLKQMLSPDVVDGDEAYEFTWVGKKASIVEANKPIRKTLRPCPEESKNWDDTENLYIEGDNLEVLKLLQESYLGKVKMIYIDPPYNTGKDGFVYPDNFMIDPTEFEDMSGVKDENGRILFSINTESNPRFHSAWCSMMYERLLLARNFLREDGVIFISIHDAEFSNLKMMCDEIFGYRHNIGTLVWKARVKPVNIGEAKYRPQKETEYILVYEKSNIGNKFFPLITGSVRSYPYTLDGRKYRLATILKSNRGANRRESMSFALNGFVPVEGQRWQAGESEIKRLYAEGYIEFKDGTPFRRYFEDEEGAEHDPFYCFMENEWSSTSETGKQELNDLLGDFHGFDTVKPVTLLRTLIMSCTQDKDIVFDFFSGSATTAHALFQLNSEQNTRRKFIMVQYPEPCNGMSRIDGKKVLNICGIGKERIRRAGDKIISERNTANAYPPPDVGFRVFKLDTSSVKDVYYSADEYSQTMLTGLESNIKEDRTDLDLLFGCLLDWGLPLSMPYRSEKIDNCTVHTYAPGDAALNVPDALIACFDSNVPENVIKEIAKRKPRRAVFRDSSFASSPEKINVFEIFKLYAPDTDVKVI